jgi:hypothetical protein
MTANCIARKGLGGLFRILLVLLILVLIRLDRASEKFPDS